MRKIFLNIVFLLSFVALCANAQGQDSTMLPKHPPKERFWDKVFVGGNIGLQFGTVTFAEISPLVGYRFTDKISAGIGATYQYYHYKDKFYDFETNVYGGRVFGRYFFTDFLFAHAEYEYLNLEAFDFFPRRRVDVGSVLAGVGYIQRFSKNSGIVAMILYNFTESAYTPYTNPIIRIGVNIGL
ncbi:MAG: hypothetical protein H0W84_12350 [Bacteroidetes bacterium]|nr:hypothetical protein [Bacteroidota bacterium]